MPILLIDVGNSRLKWVLLSNGKLGICRGFGHHEIDDVYDIENRWQELTATPNIRPGSVVMACVAGEKIPSIVSAWLVENGGDLHNITDVRPQAAAFGIRNTYANPTTLGVDRWLSLIAARHHLEGDVCVVDCGTAITLDVINSEGIHQGGMILPGITMMKQALFDGTRISARPDELAAAGKSPAGLQEKISLLGQDTRSGIEAGVIAACSGAINQSVLALQKANFQPLAGIITGGDAEQLLPYLSFPFQFQPDWLFYGLAVIAEARQ